MNTEKDTLLEILDKIINGEIEPGETFQACGLKFDILASDRFTITTASEEVREYRKTQ